MKILLKKILPLIASSALLLMTSNLFAADNILNVYTWSGEVTDASIKQFEKETGIKVNFSTYDSNEVMYAKLKADKNSGYDIVEPSSYYTDRMRRQDMLEKLDKTKLPNLKNINPTFLNQAYDPETNYSAPYVWGVTGIFLNKDYHPAGSVKRWSDLWDKKFANQLMLLDDSREVFSMALRVLGYSVNDSNPEHIKQAYLKLKELLPNIKIFNSSAVSILVDEDASVGMCWNGDLFKAKKENPHLEFVYPKDGFIIWVDNFAIPKNAPHRDNAHRFINFMLQAEIGKAAVLETSFTTCNLAAQKLLPADIKNNTTIYPTHEVLSRGEFQADIGDEALALYEKYWERLKIGG